MGRTYKLKVAGLEREPPLCEVNDELEIAAFIMLSDVELTVACARELLKKCPDFDCILTAETKGIPIAYEAARQSGKVYIVARKSMKVYMQDAVMVNVNSITTKEEQTLYLSRKDSDTMKGKRVLIMDDVISTGDSLRAIEELAKSAQAVIIGKAAALAEGDAANRDDIIFLEKLPLFPKSK